MPRIERRDFIKVLALTGVGAAVVRPEIVWSSGLLPSAPPPTFKRFHPSVMSWTNPQELEQLVRLIKQYAQPEIVRKHKLMNGAHGGFREKEFLGFAVIPGEGHNFFTWHREYLSGLERFLQQQGWTKGLPSWAPWEPIPPAFLLPRERSGMIVPPPPPIVSKDKMLKWSHELIGCWRNADDMGFYLSWGPHFAVHAKCGGVMAQLDKAPAAPIFWLWHTFIDDIYEDWLRDPKRCSKGIPWPQPSPRGPRNPVPGPNDQIRLTPWCLGTPLNIARDMITAAGLQVCDVIGFANDNAPVISQQPLPATEQVRGACVNLSGEIPPPNGAPRFPTF